MWGESGAGGDQRRTAGDRQPQQLQDVVSNILEETRIVLPGTQTLFGFQLIVVFNSRFHEGLDRREQVVHLGATLLVAVAIAMLIAPAAYHRQAEPESTSRRFVDLANRLLTWSLLPLMVAICADFYLVASVVTGEWTISLTLSLLLLGVFAGLWLLLPRRRANAQ
jgi:DMSO reductase anchor subunit